MLRPLQLRPLLPITIASLPTTQKHFDWAAAGRKNDSQKFFLLLGTGKSSWNKLEKMTAILVQTLFWRALNIKAAKQDFLPCVLLVILEGRVAQVNKNITIYSTIKQY